MSNFLSSDPNRANKLYHNGANRAICAKYGGLFGAISLNRAKK